MAEILPPGSFSIGLFQCGDPKFCIYSYCCKQCALADSRTQLDGSSWWLNFWLLNPVIGRWLIRTAYYIEDYSIMDIILGICCSPCVVNQIYQTTMSRGNPTIDGGKNANRHGFLHPLQANKSPFDCCIQSMYSFCCTPCISGTILYQSAGMPYYLGCCCSNICLTRNIMRYQYRIYGNDNQDELIVPFSMFCFCCNYCNVCSYYTSFALESLSEVHGRSPLISSGHYLHNQQAPHRIVEAILVYPRTIQHNTNHNTHGGHRVSPADPCCAPIHHSSHNQYPEAVIAVSGDEDAYFVAHPIVL